MKDRYTLYLRSDGDIEIVGKKQGEFGLFDYDELVYRKTLNPGEDVKDNLMKAYEEWERLEEGK